MNRFLAETHVYFMMCEEYRRNELKDMDKDDIRGLSDMELLEEAVWIHNELKPRPGQLRKAEDPIGLVCDWLNRQFELKEAMRYE